jgi:3-oxoacyl-[acyl-carrier-protein] synthase-1
MKKIAITGRGLVSPLGIGIAANEKALMEGRSGIVFMPDWKEMGLESQIAGIADENPDCPELKDSKFLRFMPLNAKMAVAAAYQALSEAKLFPDQIRGRKIAVIIGCAGSAHTQIFDAAKLFQETKKVKRISPFVVPKAMPSSAAANLSLILGLSGESYNISSACTSGSHAIIQSARLIEAGVYDIVITGGTEELNWIQALGFDAMRALSRKYNDRPSAASRPFDRERDGFVIASGAGILIMESEKSVRERNVKPLSYITGFSTNSNGSDMVVPNPDSSAELMLCALNSAKIAKEDVDYINTHGTSTTAGDPAEMKAIEILFGKSAEKIAINSTKSMTGHLIGAAGAVESIFCSIMIEKKFISPSLNIDNPDDDFRWADFVKTARKNTKLRHVLNNSFGFGGTNACIVISSPELFS